jgi:hypothetical protein
MSNSVETRETLAQELRSALQNGRVDFSFRKTNGEIRQAYGTTKFDFIPEENLPKGTGTPTAGTVKFFDLEKQEWRSCREDSIISIDGTSNL